MVVPGSVSHVYPSKIHAPNRWRKIILASTFCVDQVEDDIYNIVIVNNINKML